MVRMARLIEIPGGMRKIHGIFSAVSDRRILQAGAGEVLLRHDDFYGLGWRQEQAGGDPLQQASVGRTLEIATG
jgi:hypothetical protein